MFGWRRKNDGFEWRKYVRTTIKVRREERARKLDEIKQAAAAGARSGARQGLAAGREAAVASGRGALNGARWLVQWLLRLVAGAGQAMRSVVARIGTFQMPRGGQMQLPALRVSSSAKIATMFGILGALAGVSAYLQYLQSGLDWSAALAGLVAVALIGLAMAPWLRRAGGRSVEVLRSTRLSPRLPSLSSGIPVGKWAGAIALAAATVTGGWWLWQTGRFQASSSVVVSALPSMPSWPRWARLPSMPTIASLPDINGRGRAVSGDTIRIGRQFVRLAGIEAPEISQMCKDTRNRNWRCGRRARDRLRQLIRRRNIACTGVSKVEGGRFEATCTAGGKDLSRQMVSKGFAFAEGGLLKSYASEETVAREKRLGVWRGKALRPSEFRAKRWQVASRSAPDGCPIKGRVVRKAKVYVLPWALDYRQVRVRTRRGERWFCSEAEATNAGFRPSSTG